MLPFDLIPQVLKEWPRDQIQKHLKNKTGEFYSQHDLEVIKKSSFSTHLHLLKLTHGFELYLHELPVAAFRKAFQALRFQIFPSQYLEGRYCKIPVEQRYCISGAHVVEDLNHDLL